MSTVPGTPEFARKQIEVLRTKLLDLSLKNRMLNFRPSKRLSISIVGEDSGAVHRLLCEEGKKMSFVGRTDPPGKQSTELFEYDDEVSLEILREAAVDELNAFIGNSAMPVDQLDSNLNTSELESILQEKLRTIQREAALANDELGVNTLFLTLGALEWKESPQKSLHAPLLFVPVSLEKQANGRIRLLHDGGDVGSNLPLEAKMGEFNFKLPEFDDDKTLYGFFDQVESTIRSRADWVVHRNEIHLGFFNYEKYAMYVDLGGESWPTDRKPWTNPDLVALLGGGFPTVESTVSSTSKLDDIRPVPECHEVYDADGSQTIAMIRAAAGHSIVVEGPPGTGKSQTITNVIAEAVAAGKTVLFVSAKRAALDVVKRRLVEADLGNICLDLHDKLSNRREFYAELKKTVSRGIAFKREEERVDRLTELRRKLNAHSRAVNEVLNEFRTTPFEAMAALATLPAETSEDRPGRIQFSDLSTMNAAELRSLIPLVNALQERVANCGVPTAHPYWGIGLTYVDPSIKLDLVDGLSSGIDQLRNALDCWNETIGALKVDLAPTVENIRFIRECTKRAIEAPEHSGVAVDSGSWIHEETRVRQAIERVRLAQSIRTNLSSVVRPAIWDEDLSYVDIAFRKYAARWYRFVVSDYREAKRILDQLLTFEATKDPCQRKTIIEQVIEEQKARVSVSEFEETLINLFGVQWQGIEFDPRNLEKLLDWVIGLNQSIANGELPGGILSFFNGTMNSDRLVPLAESAEKQLLASQAAYDYVAAILKYSRLDSASTSMQDLLARMNDWNANVSRLAEFVSLSEARSKVLERNLKPVVDIADTWELASTKLVASVLRSYFTGVVQFAMEHRPELRGFERAMHEGMIDEFRSLDDFKLQYNRAQVRSAHNRRLPTFDNAAGNLQSLKLQCELQRKHKPIRWIMARAGEAIQRIKPVFMMSPLTVAIHLPPELPLFDMVIFDEASQIRPEDALCAIARSKQCIVVGDTRQMPPTSFFDRLIDDDVFDQDDEDTELGQEAAKLESVLSLMSSVVVGAARRPDLRWHYRSIHPMLIQPSNEMFYDNRLIVFPSSSTENGGRRIGMVFHHLDDSVYEAGSKNRVNRKEAEYIADKVVEHIRENPDESLLIAAMNKPQADLIFQEVSKRERSNQDLFNSFRARHPHEVLDIKNLETVQGDERDVVFVSVTYGKDIGGNLRYTFGPLLRDGGERRLNVLFTRARRRCEVFSNIISDEIRLESPRAGVMALKRYLKFAQTGVIDIPVPTGGQEESPFEEEVCSLLRELGYEIHTQVGSIGYRIDMAVVDPEFQGRYVLGVECDGATYHSAQSARDRDKLRQRVLEDRGWTLHRIWSHDWWQDRDGEVRRLVDAIESARAAKNEGRPQSPRKEAAIEFAISEVPRDSSSSVRKYASTVLPINLSTEDDLKQYLMNVIACEGPIHREFLIVRLRDAAGFGRAGANVRSWLERLIYSQRDKFREFEDAFYLSDDQLRQPRDWSDRPPSEKKVEYVSEAELASAIRAIVQGSFGVSSADVGKAALNLLGFKRATASGVARANHVVEKMINGGGLVRNPDDHLSVPRK